MHLECSHATCWERPTSAPKIEASKIEASTALSQPFQLQSTMRVQLIATSLNMCQNYIISTFRRRCNYSPTSACLFSNLSSSVSLFFSVVFPHLYTSLFRPLCSSASSIFCFALCLCAPPSFVPCLSELVCNSQSNCNILISAPHLNLTLRPCCVIHHFAIF